MINITIEPTDFCNAQCFYCVHCAGRPPHGQYGGFLPLKIHNRIFQELEGLINDFYCGGTLEEGVYLRYCGVGEPTLHPDFMAMLKKGFNFSRVRQLAILSNGTSWHKKMVDELINLLLSQPEKLLETVFSLDTINPKTQFKIKKINNINNIVKYLKYLLEQKAKNNLKNFHPIFQMIISQNNIMEVTEFCHFWENLCANYGLSLKIVSSPDYAKYFMTADCFIWLKLLENNTNEQKMYINLHNKALKEIGLPFSEAGEVSFSISKANNAVFSKPEQSIQKYDQICSILWYGVTIFANADVTPCCSDINLELKIGSLNDRSLSEIYKSEAMRDLRFAHIVGDLSKYPLCKNCGILYRGTPVCAEEVARYINIVD